MADTITLRPEELDQPGSVRLDPRELDGPAIRTTHVGDVSIELPPEQPTARPSLVLPGSTGPMPRQRPDMVAPPQQAAPESDDEEVRDPGTWHNVPPTRYGRNKQGQLVSQFDGTNWVDLFNGKKTLPPASEEAQGKPASQWDQAANLIQQHVDTQILQKPAPEAIISARTPGIFERIAAPIREGAIGRALGISTETAEARKEDPSNPVVRFEAALSPSDQGIMRGAAEFASGLTTPDNLLIMAGTSGLGALEGQLGKGMVGRLISAGFSGQMLHGVYQQIPELKSAWDAGDWPRVRQVLTKQLLGAGMAGLAGKHAIKGSPISEAPAAATPPPEFDPINDPVAKAIEEHIQAQELAEIAKRAKPAETADAGTVTLEPGELDAPGGGSTPTGSSGEPVPSPVTPLVKPVDNNGPLPTAPQVSPVVDEKPASQSEAVAQQQQSDSAQHEPSVADAIATTYTQAGLNPGKVEATPEEIQAAAQKVIDEKPHLVQHLTPSPVQEETSTAGTGGSSEVQQQNPPAGGSGDLRANGEVGRPAPVVDPAGSGGDGGGSAAAGSADAAGVVAPAYLPDKYYDIPPSQFKLDPVRFQFKQEGVGQHGVTDQFKDVTKWDPDMAGTVHAWYDPADGQVYPVNGHHRVDMGQRFGDEGVPEGIHTRMIDARNATEARAKGALINIGEGNGTPLDIAKFLRDSELTRAQVEAEGKVAFVKKSAQQGAALANLSQPIFDDVVAGALPIERAAIIGEGLPNKADQKILYDVIQKRQKQGRRPTNDQLEEMVRRAKGGKKVVKPADGQGDLFGGSDQVEESLLGEKAEISDYVRQH